MSASDTIYALATAPGKSGVAVVRLSGHHATQALQNLTSLPCPTPRRADYVTFKNSVGEVIDRGLALYFKGPHSFTGEDVVELHIHGSLAVIRELLGVLGGIGGLRPAEPGEFTRRAFINGKMDLVEAEGLADLIDSETSRQKTQAQRQMDGELSGFYDDIRSQMVRCLALLEAYIDFPDEEIPDSVVAELAGDIHALRARIDSVLSDARGERLRDGIQVVIVGAPNVGKSSLLNAVAGRDAAIVSHRAGTTRDVIEVHLDIAGYPVVLVDTAGIRETADDIEEEGVRRALARAQQAELKLVVFDGAVWPEQDRASRALIDDSSLVVVNKSDLLEQREEDDIIHISAKTGQGMEALLGQIEERIISRYSSESAPFITRARHRELLSQASAHLFKSLENNYLEIRCEELRLAGQAVGKITGKIQVDDVLDVVFKQFCIGK